MYEYNAAIVYAGSSRFPEPKIDLGYELLRRSKGKRKWEVVSKTQDSAKAQKWAARSGYRIRALKDVI